MRELRPSELPCHLPQCENDRSKPGGISSVGDDANPDGQLNAI